MNPSISVSPDSKHTVKFCDVQTGDVFALPGILNSPSSYSIWQCVCLGHFRPLAGAVTFAATPTDAWKEYFKLTTEVVLLDVAITISRKDR